jgi:glycosyltransferase involved in cell wall biosynthesis
VVSYDVDGAREVVRNGETGFLVQPKSIDGLVVAVSRLAADSELRARMGASGRRELADRFRQERMVDQLHCLYERLLAGSISPRTSVVGGPHRD